MSAAAAIGRAAGYTSAGTIEFLVDADGGFYFLEMNTRLQVEHPITEAVTGLDFVRAQIEIAKGERIEVITAGLKSWAATDTPARLDSNPARLDSDPVGLDFGRAFTRANGHAIEVRVYAENPYAGFLPSPGLITYLRVPSGVGIRDDSGAYQGWTVPTAYDPLVSKVIAWAPDRPGAIRRMVRALNEYDVRGISTTIGFCRDLIASPAFVDAEFDTTYVDRLLAGNGGRGANSEQMEEIAAMAAALWELARLKSSPTDSGKPKSSAAGRDFSRANSGRADSLWVQRARVESLR